MATRAIPRIPAMIPARNESAPRVPETFLTVVDLEVDRERSVAEHDRQLVGLLLCLVSLAQGYLRLASCDPGFRRYIGVDWWWSQTGRCARLFPSFCRKPNCLRWWNGCRQAPVTCYSWSPTSGKRPSVCSGHCVFGSGRPSGHEALEFLWVTDFPMFEEGEGGLTFLHHPFTSPQDVEVMASSPLQALSRAYDVVVNGIELGSGSIDHDPAVQTQVFEILGISPAEQELRFGWFLRALRYGTPPHGGFAFGIDRLVMVLQQEINVREVITFPKTQSGFDPLTEAPTGVEPAQLKELGLGLDVRRESQDVRRET